MRLLPRARARRRPTSSTAREMVADSAGAERELAQCRGGRRRGGESGGWRRSSAPARAPGPERRPQRDHGDPRRRGGRGGEPLRQGPLRHVQPVCGGEGLEGRGAVVQPVGARTGSNEITFLVKGEDAWRRLEHEGGPHRVQRVPVTESQGRIHTSSAAVAVLPEAEEVEVDIDPDDLQDRRLPVDRARRAVGQHDRLGRAHHPPADRHRRGHAGREEPDPEPGQGHDRAAVAAAQGRAGAPGRRTVASSGAARSAAAAGRRRSGPTTSRRTGSPTTASS